MNLEFDREVILQQFASKLRHIRKIKNLTQESVSIRAGLSRSYYSDIETGKRNISLLNIYKISKALDVDIKDLFNY